MPPYFKMAPSDLYLKCSNTHRTIPTHSMKCLPVFLVWNGSTGFLAMHSVKNDHKPLQQIKLKNLVEAPALLKTMLSCLQNYDTTIKYHPGMEMLVANAFFCYVSPDAQEISLNIAINLVHITPQKTEFQTVIFDDHSCAHLQMQSLLAGQRT